MVSGLRINFFKSSICGVNLKPEFLEATSVFLHCGIHSLPFKFLGIMVGDSPRKQKLWKVIVDHLRNRVAMWRGRNLSKGGRVVLFNSMLNDFPIFMFSFCKAHAVIIKEIVQIQSMFILGGSSNINYIHWIGWKIICFLKESG